MSLLTALFAQSLPGEAGFSFGTALFIVLAALGGLGAIAGVLGGWSGARALVEERAHAGAAHAPTPRYARPEEDTTEQMRRLAVIAAAVAVTGEESLRVVSVTPVSGAQAWSQEGRRQHLQSHRVR